MRRALVQTPSVISFFTTASRLAPAARATLEEALTVLRGAGLSDQAAVEAFLTMQRPICSCPDIARLHMVVTKGNRWKQE